MKAGWMLSNRLEQSSDSVPFTGSRQLLILTTCSDVHTVVLCYVDIDKEKW